MLDKPFAEWTTYVNHVGIDFPYRAGRTVRASGSGYVRWQGWSDKISGDRNTTGVGAGNAKIVVYDNGVEARYCHLMNLEGSQPGQRVNYGDVIGYVGTTGRSTGPHLHMEVWINGVIQTNNDFWRYVSKTNFIGDGYGNMPSRPAGNESKPAPVPEKSKEDTMTHSIRLNNKHLLAVGEEFISHHGTGSQYEITRNVTSASDETHNLNTAQFHDLLDGLGIPRWVVNVDNGQVFNPETGKFEHNGVWSRHREILAKLDALSKPAIAVPETPKK